MISSACMAPFVSRLGAAVRAGAAGQLPLLAPALRTHDAKRRAARRLLHAATSAHLRRLRYWRTHNNARGGLFPQSHFRRGLAGNVGWARRLTVSVTMRGFSATLPLRPPTRFARPFVPAKSGEEKRAKSLKSGKVV
jgi:hypothetical protein